MFIYVASPYSHPDRDVERQRYADVMRFMTFLVTETLTLPTSPSPYSPIVHCHQWAEDYELPKDAQWWKKFNFDYIQKASGLYVLRLDGWRESKGVAMEIDFAQTLHLPIRHWRPLGDDSFTAVNYTD